MNSLDTAWVRKSVRGIFSAYSIDDVSGDDPAAGARLIRAWLVVFVDCDNMKRFVLPRDKSRIA